MKWNSMAAIAVLGLSATNAAAEESRAAWIKVDQVDGSVSLQVFAALDAGESGTFQLVSRKAGSSGTSTSRQSGRIASSDGSAAGPFTTSRFSLRGDDGIEAELTVTTSSGRTLVDSISVAAR